MKEVLIALAVIGLFIFSYFVVDRLGRFLETVAEQNEAEAPADETTQDTETADTLNYRYQI